MVGTGGLRVADRLDHDAAEVDRSGGELATLVEPREQQQVLDELGHAHRLRLDASDGVHHVGRQLAAVQPGELGVAADRGERRAQLVARVGDEAAHLLLALLPRRQRGGDVPEHAVERGAEAAHLGAVVVDRHALGERDVAAVERQFGHPLRGRGDLGQRAERAPHHGRADDEREHEADDRDDRDRECELRRRGVRPRRAAGPAPRPRRPTRAAMSRSRGTRRTAARRSMCGSPSAGTAASASPTFGGRSSTRPPSVMYPARVVPSSPTSPASVPASCPGTFSTSPGASSGSPGNPGGWPAIATFARELAESRLASRRATDEPWKTATLTTPTTALTATSSTATMTRRRRCRVQGRRRRAAAEPGTCSVSCVRAPSRDAAAWPGSPGRVIRRPSACSPRRARCGSSARGPRRPSCAGTRCRARPRTPCRRSRTTTRDRGSAPSTARGAGCA